MEPTEIFIQVVLVIIAFILGVITQRAPKERLGTLLRGGVYALITIGASWLTFEYGRRHPIEILEPTQIPVVSSTSAVSAIPPQTQVPSTVAPFVGYDFEGASPGWTTSEGEFKIARLALTSEIAHSGSRALELYTELYGPKSTAFNELGGDDVLRHTEAVGYFNEAPLAAGESGPRNFQGYNASCFVFIPEALGAENRPSYVRLFAKDDGFANLFAEPIDITPLVTRNWIEISLSLRSDMGSDFDATKVIALGLRFDTPDDSDVAYEGPIFIDDCSFQED